MLDVVFHKKMGCQKHKEKNWNNKVILIFYVLDFGQGKNSCIKVDSYFDQSTNNKYYNS